MSLFVLDTDILTLFEAGHVAVRQQVAAHTSQELAITVLTVEEQASGWYTFIRKAKQIDPKSYDGALGAARCAFAAGEVQKASTFAAKAVDIAPRGELEARLLLGKAFIELGFKAKARHELTLVLSQHPEHKEARALLKRV